MEKNYLFKRAALAQILTFSSPEKFPPAVFLSTYFSDWLYIYFGKCCISFFLTIMVLYNNIYYCALLLLLYIIVMLFRLTFCPYVKF